MLATVIEERKELLPQHEEIVDALIKSMIERTLSSLSYPLSQLVLQECVETFAYLMTARGFMVSVSYDEGIDLFSQVLKNVTGSYPIPSRLDAYQLCSLVVATGLMKRTPLSRQVK